MGQFLGFSDQHSSLVGRVRHLGTNYVSPQYHVVYDDKFETVYNGTVISETGADRIFTDLFENARDHYGPTERNEQGEIMFEPPPLNDMWLSESERREKRVTIERRRVREKQRWLAREREIQEMNSTPTPTGTSPSHPTGRPPNGALISDDDDSSVDTASSENSVDSIGPPPLLPAHPRTQRNRANAPEGATATPEPQLRRSRRVAEGIKAKPRLISDPKFGNILSIEDPNPIFAVLHGNRQTPVLASQARITRSERKYKVQRDRRVAEYEEHMLNTMDWGATLTVSDFLETEIAPYFQLSIETEPYGLPDKHTMEDIMVTYVNPLVLAAKTTASSADNPTWDQAMKGPFAEEYWRAAEVEVETLEKIKAWTVVEREDGMNVLPGTWAFKLKRYPDGKVKKV